MNKKDEITNRIIEDEEIYKYILKIEDENIKNDIKIRELEKTLNDIIKNLNFLKQIVAILWYDNKKMKKNII